MLPLVSDISADSLTSPKNKDVTRYFLENLYKRKKERKKEMSIGLNS